MNALQKVPDALQRLRLIHSLRALEKFPQVGAGAKAALQVAIKDERVRIFLQVAFRIIERSCELLQFHERQGSQFIARFAMQVPVR
jgi:hypothetical protein